MKKLLCITLICFCGITSSINAKESEPLVYINKDIGFNVEGYDYKQPALPCDVDKNLVNLLVKRSQKSHINMVAVEGKEKVQNGTVPVVLIDIEQLVLDESHNYGKSTNSNLPKIQITAGILNGKDIQTTKHTCAIATTSSNLLMTTDKVVYHRPVGDICTEAKKCLEDLSKDVVEWLKPQVK